MSKERTIIELVVQGAQQAARQILDVAQSQLGLAQTQEQAAARGVRAYADLQRAADQAAEAQIAAAKKAQQAAQQQAAQAAAQAQTTAAGVGQGLGGRIAQRAQPVSVDPRAAPNIQAQVTALRQLATAAQQSASAQDVTTRAGLRLAQQMLATANAANKQADALAGVTNASSRAGSQGLTYLSVLSAIHAASFLSTNSTFSMIGSFTTLGLAFGKLGLAGGAAGLALGGILAIFGQISNAIQTIQQATINGAIALAGFASAVTVAAVAAGGAGIKLAADVETQLAAVRAFGNATSEDLRKVAAQADEFGARFGLSAADVVQATSLFARAGGTVKEAIDGATEAIVRLQVASQGELSAAQAAIALSAALKQFSLDGSQAVRVADNLVAAAQASALSFTGVQQAFIQAAPGAAALGITIEDLSSAIALLGDQLIKGTTTGTAFKQFILDVVNPTAQAEAELAKYGITLRDSNKNALPFIDALDQLNSKLGEDAVAAGLVSREQRATALAVAFGSRAFLAANILVDKGTKALGEYRAELAQVTTNNIVDVLLLPLNKQLERLPAEAQQAGAALGGPLLQPARQAVTQIIQFLEQIKPAAELVGQTVRTVLIGQGFAALQLKIAELVGNNALSSFLIELANSFRNVRDVIVSQIVPAVTTFIQTIGSVAAGNIATVGEAFKEINTRIQQVGAATAIAIVGLGNLIAEFVKAEGTGGALRDALERVARTILTTLVASLTTAAVTLQAAVVAMPLFARVALLAAQAALQLSRALAPLAGLLINITEQSRKFGAAFALNFDITKGVEERLADFGRASDEASNDARRARGELHSLSDTSEELDKKIVALTKTIVDAKDPFVGLGQASAENARIARTSISELTAELLAAEAEAQGVDLTAFTEADIARLTGIAGAMKQAAAGAVNPFLQTFEDAQGKLGSIFDNITADIESRSREIADAAARVEPGAPGAKTAEELEKVKNKIDEASRDIAKRLQNLAEDSAQRVTNLIRRSLERLDDIRQNALQRIDEIREAAAERISEARRTTAERREDRDAVDAERQKQDDLFTIFQRGLDKQALADDRALQDRQRIRQQDNEDFSRSTEQQFQDEETLQQRRISVIQRAFELTQQIREQAFDRAQQAELTAFQRSQQAAAEARQFTQRLAEAKTPEDKAKVQADRQQALRDASFQRGQEDALNQFRLRQEESKATFQRQQEQESLGFRQGLEDRFTSFRRQQEASLVKFRRAQEVKETTARRGDEEELLKVRLQTEDKVTARRRADALAFQQFQQQLEDKRIAEEEQRTVNKALEEVNKAIAASAKLAQEVEDKLLLDLGEQAAEVVKQARNIINTLIDLQDQVPPELFAPYVAALAKAREQAEGVEAALAGAQENAKLQVSQRSAVQQAELEIAKQNATAGLSSLLTPATTPTTPTQQVPEQVLSLQTLQVAQAILPASFGRDVAAGVQLGIRLAVEQGLIPSEVNVDLGPITDVVNDIRRGIRG